MRVLVVMYRCLLADTSVPGKSASISGYGSWSNYQNLWKLKEREQRKRRILPGEPNANKTRNWRDTLEEMVREGARRIKVASLQEEVNKFLCKDRYERGDEFRG